MDNVSSATNSATVRRVSRLGGVIGLVFLVLVIPDNNPPFYEDVSNSKILSWVHAHQTALYVEGQRTGLMMVLIVAFLGILLWRTNLPAPLRSGVWALLGASMAIDMAWAGAYYGLAFADHNDIGDSGVLALASITEQMTFTDGFLWGIAVLVISLATLRTRILPAPVSWLGILTGLVHVFGVGVQIAVTHTTEGVSGPLSALTLFFWVLAASLSLTIRPRIDATDARPAESSLSSPA
jgi:hypothetical protein